VSVVRINAITVPTERAAEFEARFAARAGEVAKAPGFEAFELLRPSDERREYLVYTRWESEEAFQAWVDSSAFQRGHKAHNAEGPVSSQSALWSFEVIQREEGAPG
jgi:heme-degrading monooxygenase HmoA